MSGTELELKEILFGSPPPKDTSRVRKDPLLEGFNRLLRQIDHEILLADTEQDPEEVFSPTI